MDALVKSSMARWNDAIERMPSVRLLVAGEIGIDEYIWGDCHRVSPEAPVPVVEVESQTLRLGLSANVAQNIVSLGAVAEVISVCGVDADAKQLSGMLSDCGIKQTILRDESRPTLRKTRIIAQKQHVVRVDYEKSHPLHPDLAGRFRKAIESRLEEYDGLIVQDYGKGLWNTDTVSIISTARAMHKPVYIDPNTKTPLDYYRGGTLITPNINEAEALCGCPRTPPKRLGCDDEALKKLAARIMEVTGVDYALITCGEWGMVGLEKSTGDFKRMPTFAREVSDVTGAGDTVIAVMSSMHRLGADIETCMKVSNAAAGLVVGRMGTASVTQEELLKELRRLAGC